MLKAHGVGLEIGVQGNDFSDCASRLVLAHHLPAFEFNIRCALDVGYAIIEGAALLFKLNDLTEVGVEKVKQCILPVNIQAQHTVQEAGHIDHILLFDLLPVLRLLQQTHVTEGLLWIIQAWNLYLVQHRFVGDTKRRFPLRSLIVVLCNVPRAGCILLALGQSPDRSQPSANGR